MGHLGFRDQRFFRAQDMRALGLGPFKLGLCSDAWFFRGLGMDLWVPGIGLRETICSGYIIGSSI